MKNFLYVDNSNLWIEGMHVAAVASGLAPDIRTACTKKICDWAWRLDFGRLFDFAGGPMIGRAVLFGSRPPLNDSLWNHAISEGFDVFVYDRNAQNREKKIDTQMTAEMITDSYELMNAGDTVTICSGDSDHIPAIEKLRGRGFNVDVCFWDHANWEVKQSATRFVSLNQHLEHLRLNLP
ncbi:MAG: NYN domain-containing protein [Phycisphaerales bacterium]|nr:NYN domain-containing protein [Phycisphaerales bacterium]